MIFSTVTFILYFLAPLLIIYYLVPKPAKNWVLLAASVIFCACSGAAYVIIPIVSVAVNYFLGILLGRNRTVPILASGAAANALLPLLFRLLIISDDIKWIAPSAILFFGTCLCSLRALTYLTDLYKGTTAVQTDPFKFGIYMLFFPTFAIGPVIKYNDFRNQLEQRKLTGIKFLGGAGLFLCGFLKKFIIADRLRVIWNAISGYDFTGLSMANAWLGFIALALYIYFMFSSFWDMGVGMCRMFGFNVNRRLRPIEFMKKTGREAWVYIPVLLVSVGCVLAAFSLKGMGQYAAALFRFGYIGWGEQDFMYRFASNIGVIILAVFVASGVIRFVIDALKPAKVRNTPLANAIALGVMAVLIAASAVNLVSIAGRGSSEKNTGSFMSGTWIRQADSRITKASFFRDRLFHLNADVGYILGQKGLNGVHYTKENTLIERPAAYNEAAADRYIEGVDYVSDPERYTTHIAVIPPAFEIMKNSLKPYTYDDRVLKTTQRIQMLLSESAVRYFNCTDTLISYSDEKIFCSTSSELTADGQYAVYKALGEEMGYTPQTEPYHSRIDLAKTVRGELWRRAGLDTTEPDTAETMEYIGSYVGTDGSADVFNSNAGNGRALVVVADRYANGIVELMSGNFDVLYSLPSKLSAEEIRQFIGERFVTDVLYLVGTDTILMHNS